MGCGVILEDTWCIIGGILYSGVDALEQGVKFCQKRNSLTSWGCEAVFYLTRTLGIAACIDFAI